ncbi:hypothetical protein B0T10DRAFT_495098 [Thelonectria olida]|uniref:Zn(2)-C6 fungal-type domain-containing protein n=1 Tax=Thelonectria olida TaxID=1576542 RepID=A0A9P8VX63_9HYPO|nr:hypothetical protein B0T10DRAFT_495098 [Thelonectria olida]
MKRTLASKRRRVRHSCERCRQKKTKCPSEKPVCSFCRRLGQTCVYLPRRNPDVRKGTASKVCLGYSPTDDFTNTVEAPLASPDTSDLAQAYPSTWLPSDPEAPPDVLHHLAHVYREMIYFQPLPLFNLHHLEDQLLSFPYYLRWGFIALSLHYESHSFYWGRESEAIEFYTTCSRNIAMELSTEGTTNVEILRLLCLLAICEIIDGQHARAWMTIGAASRLEALRISSTRHAVTTDAISRCHWSIMILEKAFTPNFTNLETIRRPDFPSSPPPPAPASLTGKSQCPGLSDAHEIDSHQGINKCSLYAISAWGDIVSYLGDIRDGLVDCPWLSTSKYAQLSVKFYEKEITLSCQHLLRHVSFPDRSLSELSENREYWSPWILTQIISHAAKAALDNPFIQLVAHRSDKGVSQPRSFLQQTVDQALFNYQWVARLVQMCEDVQFSICDPLIGYAVATTATIPWLFQFARDAEVAAKAKENLITFERVLAQLSSYWPHIAHKLKILQELQSGVGEKVQQAGVAETATVRFRPELLWDLLDPSIAQASQGPNTSMSTDGALPSATLHVTTTLIHPVADPDAQTPKPVDSMALDYSSQALFEGFNVPFLDEFLGLIPMVDTSVPSSSNQTLAE